MRRLIAAAALLMLSAAPAAAQTPGFYASGAWLKVRRDRDLYADPTDRLATHRSSVQAVTASAGRRMNRVVAFEGEIGLQQGQSFPWKFTYQFSENTEEVLTHRDVPLIGYARFFAGSGRVRLEPVVGFGYVWHRAESLTVGDCGSGNFPHACLPLATPVVSDTLNSWERAIATGADVAIRASAHVSIVPTVRVTWIDRRQYLTGYDHRGPASGDGFTSAFGVAVRWSAHAF